MRPILKLFVLLLVTDVRRSFVDPAPVDNHKGDNDEHGSGASPPDGFDEVKQLEDLKHSFGEYALGDWKTFSILKTHASAYSNVNGQREGHSETREEVENDGKLLARVSQKVDSASRADEDTTPATKVRTEVEIPSRGIHTAVVQDSQQPQEFTDNGDRRSAQGPSQTSNNNNLDKFTSFAGVQYSPLDMAEYVFWTGDEKGVTVAIEEFLQEGLMTREEAIAFLQDIKMNLDYLQAHYMQQQRLRNQEQEQAKERAKTLQKSLGLQNEGKASQHSSIPYSRDLMQALAKKNIEDMTTASASSGSKANERVQHELLGLTEDEYEELLERLRVADFLYTEYSLEEVIYQLAKVMFAQSLNRGSAEAQEALQKFTAFLEAEAEQGHISRNLEKKVLDVLIASLTDTLAEHPHLINVARDGLENLEQPTAGNHLLHQLLALNPAAAAGDTIPAGAVVEGKSEERQTKKARENETAAKNSELHGVKTSKAT